MLNADNHTGSAQRSRAAQPCAHEARVEDRPASQETTAVLGDAPGPHRQCQGDTSLTSWKHEVLSLHSTKRDAVPLLIEVERGR